LTSDHLAERLRREIEGDVLFDRFSRGRYATDASIYQIFPTGVVVPRTMRDVEATIAICREEQVPMTARGGGTSQCGQTINDGVILDVSKHLNQLLEIDHQTAVARVEPGVVLDQLNRTLEPHGLWYPVDVSTASRATLGGMTANNACGTRSIRYGSSRDHVRAIDALLADGSRVRFAADSPPAGDPLSDALLAIGRRDAAEIKARFPDVPRRVGGYNLDALTPQGAPNNLAHLLVGSEGTLAFFERIELQLSPRLDSRVVGVCHFPSFRAAMSATQHLVGLDPTAIELLDATLLALAREIPMFGNSIKSFVRGDPKALLVVEFAESEPAENRRRLRRLHEVMAELGFAWGDPGKRSGGVVDAIEPALQAKITEVRTQGLNIMMSMRSDGKPVSFIEDCCVALADLADYTAALEEIFARHGTSGTFYAHASVGTLHVRPVLNLKLDTEVAKLRAIAEETFELVRRYHGSHSGEHGDGIVRSEFHEAMFGARLVESFAEVKARFDPQRLFNPGRITNPPRMDDRRLLRFGPDYDVPDIETVFAWPGHIGAGRGLQGAVEMCNNNGACRKRAGGVMCPSYRATGDERDVVRGRANSLRLALSGQLGEDALASDAIAETMVLCTSCKACRRECPMSVDMAKMKIEVLAKRRARIGISWRDRAIAYLPRYAGLASLAAPIANIAARRAAPALGFANDRPLPHWRRDRYRASLPTKTDTAETLLFADTFNRYFEPENLRAAETVLRRTCEAPALAATDGRPLCCGRTYLATGLVDRAVAELRRTIAVLRPAIARGAVVVGLEPSCVLTFRDEAPALLDRQWHESEGRRVMLLEEYLAERHLPIESDSRQRALLHGHCHQWSFGLMERLQAVLAKIPALEVETIAPSCCGMAGAFGYQAETAGISKWMAELSLLPAIRSAADDTLILASGTSCRHQIEIGTGRKALHPVRLFSARL